MDQAVSVCGSQPGRRFLANPADFLNGKAFSPCQSGFQGLSFQELHGQIRRVVVLADLINRDGMITLKCRSGPGLAQKSLASHWICRKFRQNHLESHDPLKVNILGLKDHAHAAAAHHFQYPVVRQPSDLIRARRR